MASLNVVGDPRRMLQPQDDPAQPPLVGDPRQAFTGSLAQPGAPLAIGQVPTYHSPTDLTGKTFLGHAPTATPYGDFGGLDPSTFDRSSGSQYLQDQQQKAIERSAAARGTLLNGGTLQALQKNAAGNASQDYGDAFNRALQTYTTNRDTNQQNFGQSTGQFRGDLDIFNANNQTGLDWARLAQGAPQPQTPYAPTLSDVTSVGGGVAPMGSSTRPFSSDGSDYVAAVEAQRRQNEAESARVRGPRVSLRAPWETQFAGAVA